MVIPGARIGAESEFESRNSRVYMLEPDGNAIEGIVFARARSPLLTHKLSGGVFLLHAVLRN